MREIVDAVTRAQPDIIFVGLGFPKQERLIETLRPLLPQTWFLGIGVSFSFVAGEITPGRSGCSEWAWNGCTACARNRGGCSNATWCTTFPLR